MLPLTLEKIAGVTRGRLVGAPDCGKITATSVVRDDREVVAGSLFLCFPGKNVDGHDYANRAFALGAVAAIAERDIDDARGPYILVCSTAAALRALGTYYRSRLNIPIIGVTGSVGKTTAKEMLAAALSPRFNVLKTTDNLNNELGVPLTLLQIGAEHTAAVVEMGVSDFGEMTRLAEMARPDFCVVTAIGHCHLDRLGDLKGVLRAKSEVFPRMSRDGTAILNGDDALLRDFDPGIRRLTFGLGSDCDYRAENVVTRGTQSVEFDLITPQARVKVQIPAYGAHLALGALAAAAVAESLGVPAEDIARGLASYRPVGARSSVTDTGYITLIDDCYNANPNSVGAALRSLAALPQRRVAILGDMAELGAASNELHRDVGILAGQLGIDVVICCGEKAEFIFKGTIASRAEIEPYHFPFKQALFERLPQLIKKGDAVLVKASHSMKFEEITAALLELGETPGDGLNAKKFI
ncbi:MAG: UDP-N-acetylmuramoyl-tripeptide--D-alanyl-D-alanine ligase [Oscillospiraceae bacterium]|jgi:UDP-N-acetylmuramoyl-tripeptide--D-alanyl-D-alanine ligase|nr:UDP-N-acetylmuramoyl-tripeptide--D-alanyl-D-alanine ligase [Oscillospiraceae bacterium]